MNLRATILALAAASCWRPGGAPARQAPPAQAQHDAAAADEFAECRALLDTFARVGAGAESRCGSTEDCGCVYGGPILGGFFVTDRGTAQRLEQLERQIQELRCPRIHGDYPGAACVAACRQGRCEVDPDASRGARQRRR